MAVITRGKKGQQQTPRRPRRGKMPSSSLHGRGVAVSVDERLEDLVRRYPALESSLGPLLLEGKKRIRDFPPSDQERLLRVVFALKKAAAG